VLDHFTQNAPHDLVLVHGAGGNNLLWRRTAQYLSGDSKSVAVNLPGHPSGQITCSTVEEYSEALREFIIEAGMRKPVVCGHSMGSAIALKLAMSHPGDVGGLVLVSGGAKLGVDPTILEGLRDEPIRAIEKVITPMSFNGIDLGLGREARAALSVSNLPVFLNDYLACDSFDVRTNLRTLAAPTLVVCGDKDRMTPPRWSHYLHDNMAGSDLYFVKDSGHMVPLEKPASLASVLQSYLAALTR
jgi:pimeloyl-ACP methyl ester carboxylesterase